MTSINQSRYFDPKLFAKMANMPMIARLVVEGMIAGRHRSPFHGFSVEFSEYRKYCPGDDVRNIDWKVLAKFDKVYLKQYEAETNLKAYLLLDVSGSMGYAGDGLTKLEYASYCAAALAYLMIRQQDAVGMVAFDRDIRRFLSPKTSPQHLKDIMTTLDGLKAGEPTDISSAFHKLAERIRRRGLILVFSDFMDEPEQVMRGLAHFRHKKHEVILFHMIDRAEREFPFEDYVEFEDLETGQRMPIQGHLVARRYRERFGTFLEDLQRRCAEHGIEYVPMQTDRPIELALLHYLGKRARLG